MNLNEFKEVVLEDILSDDDLEEVLEFQEEGEEAQKEEEQEQQEIQEGQEGQEQSNNNYKIFSEFITDILNTFPEYTQIVSKWWTINADEETKILQTQNLIDHCKRIYPERFFDILYKNENMFSLENNEIVTEFLPGILFKHLWNLDISENTKEIIWKYLQLILFSVIGDVHSHGDFKDTAKLFEFIDENELKEKLGETFSNIYNDLDSSYQEKSNSESSSSSSSSNIPSVDELKNHLNSILEGKLGKMAMEFAEEVVNDLQENGEEFSEFEDKGEKNIDSKKIFEKLFKNPTKFLDMIKNICKKFDEKIKSGEYSESELMEEGAEILHKFKNNFDMQKMFSQFVPGFSKGSKINVNAMESEMNKNIKKAKMKERMKSKLQSKAEKQELDNLLRGKSNIEKSNNSLTDEELVKIFRSGDKPDKTPRIPKNKNKKR
jgi:hypothetical protein